MPTGYFSINDPFGFSAAYLSVGSLFPTSGLSIDGSPASGNLWVNLPKATFGRLQGGKPLVIDQKILTALQARDFARFFKMKTNAAQIPWILGPMSAIPVIGNFITIATSTVDGLQRLSSLSVNSDQLSVLIAAGGAFNRTLGLEANERLTAAVFYAVRVGNEARSYAICSATYGLNVV
nr:hypothetical protein [uncultured Rhodopila sp.]